MTFFCFTRAVRINKNVCRTNEIGTLNPFISQTLKKLKYENKNFPISDVGLDKTGWATCEVECEKCLQ